MRGLYLLESFFDSVLVEICIFPYTVVLTAALTEYKIKDDQRPDTSEF